jgi:hypothetical protein
MKRLGRPKEKEDASKLTLYLEDSVIVTLDLLAEANKTSRSRIVEELVRAASGRVDFGPAGRRMMAAAQLGRPASSTVPSGAIALASKAEEKHDREHRKSK